MADLVAVVPTRGRPERAGRLIEQIERTRRADTHVVLSVDFSDPTFGAYESLLGAEREWLHMWAVDDSQEPSGHVRAINEAVMNARPAWQLNPKAFAKLDDDHWPLTEGWDAAMLDALDAPGVHIVYGDDLLQGENLPTAPAMSAELLMTLGWMGPPVLRHLYVDNFWRDLGRAAGCLYYLPRVVIEHRHPFAHKAAMDEGYARANAPEQYQADKAAYEAWLVDPLGQDAAVRKARALMAVPTR
jgi:hypothetical protein